MIEQNLPNTAATVTQAPTDFDFTLCAALDEISSMLAMLVAGLRLLQLVCKGLGLRVGFTYSLHCSSCFWLTKISIIGS